MAGFGEIPEPTVKLVFKAIPHKDCAVLPKVESPDERRQISAAFTQYLLPRIIPGLFIWRRSWIIIIL